MNTETQNRIWLSSYPKGVPADIDADHYHSLADLLEESFGKYADRVAYDFLGKDISYKQVDDYSKALATYLQSLGLSKGDRVAVMMPNIPQFPISAAAVLRAGFTLISVNPLYIPRELEHQLNDGDTETIIVLENFASTLQQVLPQTKIKNIVLCTMGQMVGGLKGAIVNFVVRHVKKLVPAYSLPTAIPFFDAIENGRKGRFFKPDIKPEDIALLQYTGGTTGVAKGAVLSNRNITANVLQAEAWNGPVMKQLPEGMQGIVGCALPLFHIFGFTVNMILSIKNGSKAILIPNPRDLSATLKALKPYAIHLFPAVNTLFNALAHHPDFNQVNWSQLKVSLGGGMAVQSAVAKLWLEKTGCSICEGYGLSETSPVACCNPVTSKEYTGTIGVPLPNTLLKIVDDDGNEVAMGERGEVSIKGPQVMSGYWRRPVETAATFTADGFFKTGDIGIMDERGYFKIVDRKKNMILVSGFNVYPNEVEDVVTAMPGILECACIGAPDEKSGEVVRLVVVKKDPDLTEEAIREYCKENLTGYKRPKYINFVKEVPKTPVGKILHRELRASFADK